MKKFLPPLLLLLSLTLSHTSALAQDGFRGRGGNFGLGLIIGSPTALTGKLWFNNQEAMDFGLHYSFSDEVNIYADYLLHFPRAFASQRAQFLRELAPYVGIGGLFHVSEDPPVHRNHRHRDESDVNVNLRIPLGVEWRGNQVPLGVFLELVPGIYIIPEIDASFQGGLGVRYYF